METEKQKSFLTSDQKEAMQKATPEDAKQIIKLHNGIELTGVKGHYIKGLLNTIFQYDWDFIIVSHEINPVANQVIVLGKLIVRNGEKKVTKTQFGGCEIDYVSKPITVDKFEVVPSNIANNLKSAATDALKKCASELGMCADVYRSEIKQPEEKKELDPVFESMLVACKKAKTKKQITDIHTKYEGKIHDTVLLPIIDKYHNSTK